MLLALGTAGQSKPVSQSAAAATARAILSQIKKSDCAPQPLRHRLKAVEEDSSDNNAPAFYVFNDTTAKAYAVIAGDDDFPPLVAYSLSTTFPNQDEMPVALIDFLNAYSRYVKEVRARQAIPPAKHVKGDITGDVVVAPMLTCTWGQDSPYNYYCPNQWPSGCVAMAMSQIMYYWKYPTSGKGKITYSTAGKNVTVNFAESEYDWSIMKDSYTAMDWKKPTGQNVAKLCYDCGVACYMEYDQSGSGATIVDAYNAMFTHFGYNASDMTLHLRLATDTQEEWNAILFAELDSLRPVLYAGVSSTGGGSDAAGHAFVIDGYDTNHFVHVNWGWNGNYNGYYDLTLLNPSGYTFSDNQQMVVGIKPDETGEHTQRKPFRMEMSNPLSYGKNSTPKLGSTFSLSIGGLYNRGTYAATYTLAIMLYDQSHHFVQQASLPADNLTFTLGCNYGYSTFGNVRCSLPELTPEGYYYFSVETLEKGFVEYVRPFTVGGEANNRLWALVKDGYITLGVEPPAQLSGDVNSDGKVDISDIVAIINHIAGTASFSLADVNADNKVDISDIVAVINIIAAQ